MSKRLIMAAVAVAAVLLAVPATAGALIQVQRAISGVPLRATQAQVRSALGAPARVHHGTNDFGAFTEFRYAGRIVVTFQGNTTVTAVSTSGVGDRTSRGIGVGSTEAAVRARVAGVHCMTEVGVRHCQVGQSLVGRRVTDFLLRNGKVTRVTVGFVID